MFVTLLGFQESGREADAPFGSTSLPLVRTVGQIRNWQLTIKKSVADLGAFHVHVLCRQRAPTTLLTEKGPH